MVTKDVGEDIAHLVDAVDGEGAGDHAEHGDRAAHNDQEVQELLDDLAALIAEHLEDLDLVAHGGNAHADDHRASDDRQHLVVGTQGRDHIVRHRIDQSDPGCCWSPPRSRWRPRLSTTNSRYRPMPMTASETKAANRQATR